MHRLDKHRLNEYAKETMDFLRNENIPLFRKTFLKLHSMDQATIFVALDLKERAKLYHNISAEEFSNIFQELDYKVQRMILQELHETYAADMFNEMNTDDAASFLVALPEKMQRGLLQKMNDTEASEIQELMGYPEETAGSIMTKDYVQIRAASTAREVLAYLQTEKPDAETIYYLYVVNEHNKLTGILSLRELITNNPSERVENLMRTQLITIQDDDDQEDVARIIQHYDLLALPVLTDAGALVGIVTVDDVMDVVEDETTEDIGELSAVRGATDVNLSAFASARKRAPWLILLMFLGLLTGGVIDQFEETLEAVVILAVFIPMIMDSAGNIGTQSLAVVVRGIAVGTFQRESIRQLLKRQLGTGLMVGLMCGAVIFVVVPLIPFFDGSWMLGAIVGISIFLSLSIACVVGAIMPLIINKLKLDPALASGPFVTTIGDVVGLFIYFSIATSLLQYL
ncbi:magnesium transporter [Salicibibacter halophilus]|uniref:Magnesium transporter MgtE n=1 Tax=Salicibibacter halophilus TaxID=2502791 RepID=A0A514LGQ5_9BACI|nr:magnesium transporter [Salicibibacter halophilus]